MEQIALDQDRLGALCQQLGAAGAEEVVARALEELTGRLSRCEETFGAGEWGQLRRNGRAIVAIAEQLGMMLLARVARDLTQALDRGDGTALAAILCRLARVGERSLGALWDLQEPAL